MSYVAITQQLEEILQFIQVTLCNLIVTNFNVGLSSLTEVTFQLVKIKARYSLFPTLSS